MKSKLTNNIIFSWIFFFCSFVTMQYSRRTQACDIFGQSFYFIKEWRGEANNASGSLTTTETLCLDKDFHKLYICVTPLTSTEDPVGFVLYLHLCGADTASECSEWQIFVSTAAALQKALYEMQFSLPAPWGLSHSPRQCAGNIFLVRSLVCSFPVNFPLSINTVQQMTFSESCSAHNMLTHHHKMYLHIPIISLYPHIEWGSTQNYGTENSVIVHLLHFPNHSGLLFEPQSDELRTQKTD